MQLATIPDGGRDGRLVVVAEDDGGFVAAPAPVATLQAAIDDWDRSERLLADAHARLAEASTSGDRLDVTRVLAPLPRAYQWAEGSTYLAHMERLRAARGASLPPGHGETPAVYQTASDAFLAPHAPIPLGDPAWGLDLEATIAVITDDVPLGTSVEEAAGHIKLLALANDLTYRHLLSREYAVGVGFYQAKPLRPLAPLVVTPASLGDGWRDGLLHADVRVEVNGETLGEVDAARDAAFTFPELIAHMTLTRPLAAGTVVGSGTVANRDPASGFGCLAERRAHEIVAQGSASTSLLRAGDRVRIEAFGRDGRSLFGAIDHTVVQTGEEQA